jgi:hypothetical protein
MATTNADQNGPAEAKAVNDPPLGTNDPPADCSADAADKQTYFIVPRTLSQQLPEFVEGMKIPFYRPVLGHALNADAMYAIRTNDAYHDAKAGMENERSYVRKACFKANEITFYRCVQKHPIFIVRNFAAEDIKEGNKRAIDCAVARCSTVRPQGKQAFQIDDAIFAGVSRFRITGPTHALAEIAALAQANHHFCVKESHVKGASVAHAYYDEETARLVGQFALIDKVNSILTSEHASQQVTLRGDIPAEQLLAIGLTLQQWGCATTLRTYGTLRVTFPDVVTGETYKKLKTEFPQMSVFTDTPINAWADGRPRLPQQGKSRSSAVSNAHDEGCHVARFCCDTAPHPLMFKAIAAHFNGTLMEILDDKYNTAPMGCLIKFTPRSWTELTANVDITDYFAINGTNWLITPIRSKRV